MRSQCSAHHFSFQRIHVIIVLEYSFRISALQQGRKRKIFPLASHRCMNVLVEYSSLLARSRGCCWGQDHGARIPQTVGIFRIRVPALAPKIPYFLFGYALFFQITALSPLLINVLFLCLAHYFVTKCALIELYRTIVEQFFTLIQMVNRRL